MSSLDGASRRPRVLVAGHWDEGSGYPRTEALLAGLRAAGCDVAECRAAQPKRRGSKTELVSRPWRWPGYWLASRRARHDLRRLFQACCEERPPDLVLVPYPGHLAVRWLRSWYDGPIVLDLFLSAWGTAIEDRRLFKPGSIGARMFAALDRKACEAADLVLMDTAEHAALVAESTGLPLERFDWVPVCDPVAVPPRPVAAIRPGDPLRALFFGTGVPLHGLSTIVKAVARVPEIELTLIGGDEAGRQLAAELLGDRVDLRARFVPIGDLRRAIDAAQLVLGVFGTSRKAQAVVPFKLVHALNHGRAVLTGDTPAVRGLLEPGVDCLVAAPGDEVALADALAAVVADPGRLDAIARAGRQAAARTFSIQAIGERLGGILRGRLGLPAPESRLQSDSELVLECVTE